MAPIRQMIRASVRHTANNLARVVKEKAAIKYDDAYWQLKVSKRFIKESVETTVPYVIVTGLGKASSSFKRTQFLPKKQAQNIHAVSTGRIEKAAPIDTPICIRAAQRAAEHAECARKKEIARKAKIPLWRKFPEDYTIEDRAKLLRPHVVDPFVAELRAERKALDEAYRLRTPPPSPILGPQADTENMTDEESRQFADNCLKAVIGEDKFNNMRLLPSGHNPMEPNIAEYNQQVATNNLLNAWEAHKAEERRILEEYQRQVDAFETWRSETQVLVNYHIKRYDERIEKLVDFGADLTKGVDEFLAAMQACHLIRAEHIVDEYTAQVLEPIEELFKELNKEIPLEHSGANKLNSAWALDRLNALLDYLRPFPDTPPKVVYMAQKIQGLLNAIANPTPFVSPLANASPPAPPQLQQQQQQQQQCGFQSQQQPGFQYGNGNSMANAAPAEGFFIRGAAAGSSTVPVKEGSGFAKLLAATAERVAGGQQDASSSTPAPGATGGSTINLQAQSSANKGTVLALCNQEYMDVETQVNDLVDAGTVKTGPRREARRYLQNLLDSAGGDERFLALGEPNSYLAAIDRCLAKINKLPKGKREQPATRELRMLAARAKKIWVQGPACAPVVRRDHTN